MQNRKGNIVKFLGRRSVLVALLTLWIVMSFASPHFLTINNLLNVMLQVSTNTIIGVGMTLVIITGGIDLSVGSVVATSGALMAILYKKTSAMTFSTAAEEMIMVNILPLIVPIVVGALIGCLNGYLISRFNMPPMIMTLGTQFMGRGAAFLFTHSQTISVFSDAIRFLGNNKVFGIVPIPIILALGMVALFSIVMKYTRFGRYVYAFGGNKEALTLAGVDSKNIEFWCYVISSTICGFMAIITVGRFNVLSAVTGTGYEMDAIAAAIVGGTSITGGSGTVSGTLMGALFIGTIRNGLNLLNVDASIQPLVIGFVMVLAVLFDMYNKRKLAEEA